MVKFKNGMFGVRKTTTIGWWLFKKVRYEYKSFTNEYNNYWWGRESECFVFCMATEENARAYFERVIDYGEVVCPAPTT